jgi:uncharacterized iron-regulated membrane protein
MNASVRSALVRVHRVTGLFLAAFLFVSGVTGSLIAFWPELDAALNPELFSVRGGAPAPPPAVLAAKVEAADPRAQVVWMSVNPGPGEPIGVFVAPRTDPATKAPYDLNYNQLALDPSSGAILGKRFWGACCFERKNLMPFLHTLHYTLYLPERVGVWVMGLIALLWFADCFVAIGLTFPTRRPFLSRWANGFRIQRGTSGGRFMLDLHRAGGLWLWLLLAILAMSGVALNLEKEVFRPVVSFLLPVDREPVPPKAPADAKPLGFAAVAALADRDAERLNWGRPGAIYHDLAAGTYFVSFQRSLLDRGEGMGINGLVYSAATGALVEEHVHGSGRVGNIVLDAQFPLHSGRLLGTPGRVVICVAGLVVAALSGTGVLMWSRRRRAKAHLRSTRPAPVL